MHPSVGFSCDLLDFPKRPKLSKITPLYKFSLCNQNSIVSSQCPPPLPCWDDVPILTCSWFWNAKFVEKMMKGSCAFQRQILIWMWRLPTAFKGYKADCPTSKNAARLISPEEVMNIKMITLTWTIKMSEMTKAVKISNYWHDLGLETSAITQVMKISAMTPSTGFQSQVWRHRQINLINV